MTTRPEITEQTAPSDGPLGPSGYRQLHEWTSPSRARARAAEIVAALRGRAEEIMRNPHLEQEWAHEVVRAPQLLAAVQGVIGPNVAVENTFLVIKWPGRDFEVPWHQEGINHRLELDPHRSVAAWVALTDAEESTGCLHVIPGSQRAGYLPFEAEPATGAARGRALGVHVGDTASGLPVAVPAGSGLLMDTRLVHCSHSNTGTGARIGLNIRFVAPGSVSMRDGSSPSPAPISGTGW
ncbi:phytanoyl-CoA dioxygenase family protein [Streptomyces sp. MI02-2A]|uniref:phytanoyl-CoA dioxygenase family protein n=1 Tax=unclassified Streptomyces TaxID=2593676 RepID=UPI000E25AE84|nr:MULTISPECIES: phytanoyl-CoA dioxygenase family protein [unclassified Streptomyces]MDX3260856.1 phytanoyl-CoA dioxygenase family protein [Streptomyces sp. MI02-2A]REE63991.1 phytanoyl-CoA dioxygenase PhyH [Streptomyces sp. 3212.3]